MSAANGRRSPSPALSICGQALIMDEPTAALGPHETAQAGAHRRLRDQGIGILLVATTCGASSTADRVVVLKYGEVVGSVGAAETSEDVVGELSIRGRKLAGAAA
jgi:D-xylose transport system ATP-binding protein